MRNVELVELVETLLEALRVAAGYMIGEASANDHQQVRDAIAKAEGPTDPWTLFKPSAMILGSHSVLCASYVFQQTEPCDCEGGGPDDPKTQRLQAARVTKQPPRDA